MHHLLRDLTFRSARRAGCDRSNGHLLISDLVNVRVASLDTFSVMSRRQCFEPLFLELKSPAGTGGVNGGGDGGSERHLARVNAGYRAAGEAFGEILLQAVDWFGRGRGFSVRVYSIDNEMLDKCPMECSAASERVDLSISAIGACESAVRTSICM